MIVLVTMLMVLVIAFFSLARLERRASHLYAGATTNAVLEETVLNLSIGQIRDATTFLPDDELWTSQPGMVRRYGPGGELRRVFKLYSAEAMVADDWKPGDDAPPDGWRDESGTWVDMNEPARLDPDGDGQVDSLVYPVVDPTAAFDGFALDPAPGATPDQPAPMPVRWLYVLRDGSLHPSAGSGRQVVVAAATPQNPVVSRVAFWTDDESCKLNVNTASEPTPWDTPRMISKEDLAYGTYQPFQKEFQRYPGHPYTTALSPVLAPGRASIDQRTKEDIYEILPRVAGGGSQGGTVRMDPKAAVRLDSDRLFATVDEFLFDPDRGRSSRLVTPTLVRTGQFFLTAQSRAPEVNLFGLPRISMWPVGPSERQRTIFDKLSVFCATIGDKSFSVQHGSPLDPGSDARLGRNPQLWNYLLDLTSRPVPGYGASLQSRWNEDHPQVCAAVLDYIRCTNLRDTTNPRFKFSGQNGQVAPLRLSVGRRPVQGFGRYHTISEVGLHFICAGDGGEEVYRGQRSPNGTLGRGEVLVEAALLMEPFAPAQGFFTLNQNLAYEVSGLDQLSIDGQRLFARDKVTYTPRRSFGASWHGRSWGGPQGVRTFIQDTGKNYPFLSPLGRQALKLSGKSGARPTMAFSGGEITIKIYLNGIQRKNLTQTIKVDFPSETFPVPRLVKTGTEKFRGCGSTTVNAWWSFASRYSFTTRCPHVPGPEYRSRSRQWPPTTGPAGFKQGGVFRAEDVVRTLSPWHGDNRHVAAQVEVGPELFKPNHFYDDQGHLLDHLFADTQGTQLLFGFANEPGVTYRDGYGTLVTLPDDEGTQLTDADYHFSRLPDVPVGSGEHNKWGDFDNGCAQITDGAYINKPDEGNVAGKAGYSYFAWNYSNPTEVIFSPNRLMPSPGMLGSLPTGVKRDQPWQTLLFRPQDGHPGAEDPPDHLLLDLFWMPVIEPYPISEPFSTSGKVNLNYQIAPFTWITRATAMHGVLKSEMPLALPNQHSRGYKLWDHETSDHPWLPTEKNLDAKSQRSWRTLERTAGLARRKIDPGETLRQFEERFEKGEVFRSASEICEVHLVRESESLANYTDGSFWKGHLLTGDNTRERPYANIYGRVTTKSNVFRSHFRVEKISIAGTDPARFTTDDITVRASRRGSALIERFVDPNDPDLDRVDFAARGEKKTVDDFYRFRILERREFKPE
ncbi:MAG: Verru_Chthon cassette protein A [Akkermansiaceae bacterium]|nr:Verru_Chthon cassette protein A [Akkermansiaceae bacterium]